MIVGIDLGTTNSLVSVWRDGAAQIIPNALGQLLTPSVVAVDDKGEVVVGLAARERLLTSPESTASVFKRYMGSNRTLQLGGRAFRPEELSSLVLRSLKADAESALGCAVEEAVITVPAYFSDAQRKATRIAGQLAGLKVDRLLNEPTAAALAYGLHQLERESKFLVFDLGGGTFDVSILEMFEGVMEVRASAGDNFLGGEDFVGFLAEGFIRATRLDGGKLPVLARASLREQAERAKRRLSAEPSAAMRLRVEGGRGIEWTVSEQQFEAMSAPLLARLRAPVERALRDARIRAAELDQIVLAGGATRMPMVRRLVAKMFGRIPAANLNPDEVVAMGAAVQAGLKARDSALEEVVLTDVSPYSLGIASSEELAPGHFEAVFAPIIERNTVVPASRTKGFVTTTDNQREILARIYQGESRSVDENIFLGEVRVQVPARPAGMEPVDVRFSYDINGLLEVEASVRSTRRSARVVIESNPGVLSPEEIAACLRKLSALKIHPREESENRAVLERAERIYRESLGDRREAVGRLIGRFLLVLDRQDPHECQEARAGMQRVLDDIDGESYL
ncbi:MAG: molecular chaperone HscC [Betaproteobacteria bacterium]|nr:molecular chaperone HscC [Betaproteobacteria bacterium]